MSCSIWRHSPPTMFRLCCSCSDLIDIPAEISRNFQMNNHLIILFLASLVCYIDLLVWNSFPILSNSTVFNLFIFACYSFLFVTRISACADYRNYRACSQPFHQLRQGSSNIVSPTTIRTFDWTMTLTLYVSRKFTFCSTRLRIVIINHCHTELVQHPCRFRF